MGAAGALLLSGGKQLLMGELADGLEQAIAGTETAVISGDKTLLDQRGERIENIGHAAA